MAITDDSADPGAARPKGNSSDQGSGSAVDASGSRGQRRFKRLLTGTASLLVFGVILVAGANLIVLYRGDGQVRSEAGDTSPSTVGIILGAQVKADGTMSSMLADRVAQGAALWHAGKVDRILASGDHGTWRYDEPTVMRRALVAAGIPGDIIFTDHAGFDTRASMERARGIFGIEDATVVTQGFHMKRALYLAKGAGIRVAGLTADRHPYGRQGLKNSVREVASRVKAVFETLSDSRVTGGPPVPITGLARASWGPAAPPGTPPAGAPADSDRPSPDRDRKS